MEDPPTSPGSCTAWKAFAHAQHSFSLTRWLAQQLAVPTAREGPAQDLERHVAAEHGAGVWRMLPWFLPLPSMDQDEVSCSWVGVLSPALQITCRW